MTTPAETELDQKRARLRQWVPADQQQTATRGVDHLAVFAKDLEATAAFYSEVLGMPVINVTANRDEPESTHMNVDLGNGTMLSFFDFPHVPRLRRKAPEGVGGSMHLALSNSPERLQQAKESLSRNKVKFQEIGGGLYFSDPKGLGIELTPRG